MDLTPDAPEGSLAAISVQQTEVSIWRKDRLGILHAQSIKYLFLDSLVNAIQNAVTTFVMPVMFLLSRMNRG